MSPWLREIGQSWRASLRRPGFLLLAVAVLGLGVGATVTVVSVIEQVLLRPLPVPQRTQLVVAGRQMGDRVGTISPRDYQHLAGVEGIEQIGLKQAGATVNVAADGQPEQLPLIYADRQLLPTLGLQPLFGRNFSADEDRPGGAPVVMLGHGFWQRHYGGDPLAVGQRLLVEGVPRVVVGILPAAFNAAAGSGELVVPMGLPVASTDDAANYMAVARLRRGASLATVSAAVDARLHALELADGMAVGDRMPSRYAVQPLADWLHRDAGPVLKMFLLSALLLLLIAWINLGNLMGLRMLARSHELAVRQALGATTPRLLLPLLAEATLVGTLSGWLGLLLSMLGLPLLQDLIPPLWLNEVRLHVGAWGIALAMLLGIPGALLASLLGAWRVRRLTQGDLLRAGGRDGMGRQAGRLSRVLVVAQVALATVLLCAAGGFMQALYHAAEVPLGFSGERVLSFELAPVKADYPDGEAVQRLIRQLLPRLQQLPGIDAVAVTTNLPSSSDRIGSFGPFSTQMHVSGGRPFNAQYHGVSEGFFETLSIRLLQGRRFTRADRAGGERVAVVSQDFADAYYAGHALGQTIEVDGGDNVVWPARIVGVVNRTWQDGPLRPGQPVLYVPLAQMPDAVLSVFRRFEPLRFVLRGQGDPAQWQPAIRHAVAELAPLQPLAHFYPMQQIVRATTEDARINLSLMAVFSGLALLLAAVGLYAVLAVAVAAREIEFGIHAALGATPRQLRQQVLRSAMAQLLPGVLLGLLLALLACQALTVTLTALLGRLQSLNLWLPMLVAGVLLLVGLLAGLRPAMRAARVPLMRVLRGS